MDNLFAAFLQEKVHRSNGIMRDIIKTKVITTIEECKIQLIDAADHGYIRKTCKIPFIERSQYNFTCSDIEILKTNIKNSLQLIGVHVWDVYATSDKIILDIGW